jgi:hypothetical protein
MTKRATPEKTQDETSHSSQGAAKRVSTEQPDRNIATQRLDRAIRRNQPQGVKVELNKGADASKMLTSLTRIALGSNQYRSIINPRPFISPDIITALITQGRLLESLRVDIFDAHPRHLFTAAIRSGRLNFVKAALGLYGPHMARCEVVQRFIWPIYAGSTPGITRYLAQMVLAGGGSLDEGIDYHRRGCQLTTLHRVIMHGSTASLKELLDLKADPNKPAIYEATTCPAHLVYQLSGYKSKFDRLKLGFTNTTPLHEVIDRYRHNKNKRKDMAQALLNAKANINESGYCGRTQTFATALDYANNTRDSSLIGLFRQAEKATAHSADAQTRP